MRSIPRCEGGESHGRNLLQKAAKWQCSQEPSFEVNKAFPKLLPFHSCLPQQRTSGCLHTPPPRATCPRAIRIPFPCVTSPQVRDERLSNSPRNKKKKQTKKTPQPFLPEAASFRGGSGRLTYVCGGRGAPAGAWRTEQLGEGAAAHALACCPTSEIAEKQ